MKKALITLAMASVLISGSVMAKETLGAYQKNNWNFGTHLYSTITTISPAGFLDAVLVWDMNNETRDLTPALRSTVSYNNITWTCSGSSTKTNFNGSCTSNATDGASITIEGAKAN